MRAIKLPYPLPEPAPKAGALGNACIGSVGSDAECGNAELRKAVELQSPGHEPRVLEIRFSR